MSQQATKKQFRDKCPTCTKSLECLYIGASEFTRCTYKHPNVESVADCRLCHCGHPRFPYPPAPQPQGSQSPEVVETPQIPQFDNPPPVISAADFVKLTMESFENSKKILELTGKLAQSEAKLAAMSIELEAAKTHIVKLEEKKEKAYAKSQARRDALKSEKQHVVAAKGEKSGKPYVSHKNQHSNSNASPDSNQKTKPRFNKYAKSVGNKPETVNTPLNNPISMPESQTQECNTIIIDESVPVVSEVHAADVSLSEASSS
jgi:hypothetical protein